MEGKEYSRRYAAEHWASHVQVAHTSHIMRMMETLFDFDFPHFAARVRIYDMDKPRWHLVKDTATPLYYAALCGFDNLVKHLVKKYPGHLNALGGQDDYPMVAALHKEHTQVANLLLQHDANVDRRGTDGRTPLHQAITLFNETVLGALWFLLKHGADANCQQLDSRTPLHLAAAWGNDKITQILLGPPSAHEGDFGLVQLLIDHGAVVNTQDMHYIAPLHFASYRRNFESVQLLLNHGTNVNAQDTHGRTPLHQVFEDSSIHEDSFGLIQLLVK